MVATRPGRSQAVYWQVCGLLLLSGCGGGGYGGDGGSGGGTTYTVGGTVSGLTGSGLVLRNNGGDDLPVSASGIFAFATEVANGAAYFVTVSTQPANPTQTCTVTNGSGTMGSSNVANVSVECSTVVGSAVYSLVHAFTGGAEGASPYDGVIGDAAGNLYGTTRVGGDQACNAPSGCGTVFMVDASGNLLTLHTFAGGLTDGAFPNGPLTRDAAGNLYGTTASGGNGSDPAGYGTVFKLDAAGNETVLHHFTGLEGGSVPAGGVLRDSQGNLYGVTIHGGHVCSLPISTCGTVFRLEPDGTFTTLHRFAAGGTEGSEPQTALILDAKRNLYGTTYSGGVGDVPARGSGTVFRIDSAGVLTTLYDFANSGTFYPGGPLMRDDVGNLYGVTKEGGDAGGGTIFRLDPEGELSILHAFEDTDIYEPAFFSDEPGGAAPYAGLVGDPTGIVYGATLGGGEDRRGIVYRFDMQSQAFKVLHTFTDAQGGGVEAPLVRDSTGVLYGTTRGGGDQACNAPYGCGAVFRID
jgi:uncharacterized repeat protein (TIGR03803 family)